MSCSMCESIVENKKNIDGHKFLELIDTKKADIVGQNVYFSFYKCSQCGQNWRYENDKNDLNAGWMRL
jgi:hypothetical protein